MINSTDPTKLREDLRRLQEEVNQLWNSVRRIKRDPYLVAQQVFGSLLFYRAHYASTKPYQDHLEDILGILRTRGTNEGDKFLIGLADLLEQSELAGPWPGTRESALGERRTSLTATECHDAFPAR